MGGRYFFGGGPFALGMEFGWNGMFFRDQEEDFTGSEVTSWYNYNNFYASLTAQIVFGRGL